MFPVQTQLGALLGLGTHACYEASSDLWVKYVKTQWLTTGDWGCTPNNGPELAAGQPNSS